MLLNKKHGSKDTDSAGYLELRKPLKFEQLVLRGGGCTATGLFRQDVLNSGLKTSTHLSPHVFGLVTLAASNITYHLFGTVY